jgi:hypothetical protein
VERSPLRKAGATRKEEDGRENKNGRDACACRPEFVCEVVRPANREHTYLEGLDVRGLQAFGALGDFEFNRLAIIQRLVAISHDRGEMDENVLSTLALDESKALAGIEPLHCSLFFTHCIYSFLLTALRSNIEPDRVGAELLISYLVPRLRTPQKSFGPPSGAKKSRKFDLATALRLRRRYKSNKRKNRIAQPTILDKTYFGAKDKDATQRSPRAEHRGRRVGGLQDAGATNRTLSG